MKRAILKGEAAALFYNSCQEKSQFPNFSKDFARIGGWWKDDVNDNTWVAFDFTDGTVYIEEFNSEEEAVKYASGEIATTKDGEEI